jgi:hypothetical protein
MTCPSPHRADRPVCAEGGHREGEASTEGARSRQEGLVVKSAHMKGKEGGCALAVAPLRATAGAHAPLAAQALALGPCRVLGSQETRPVVFPEALTVACGAGLRRPGA